MTFAVVRSKGTKLFRKLGEPRRTLITVHCRSPCMDVYGLGESCVKASDFPG